MLEAILRGRYLSIGGGRNRKTCANVRTVARAARLSIQPRAASQIAGHPFIVADPAPYTVRQLEQSMLRAAGIINEGLVVGSSPRSLRSLPLGLALALAAVVETVFRLRRHAPGRRPPITVGQIRRIAADNVYHTETLPHLPGWDMGALATLDEGMAEEMAWYAQQKQGRG